MVAVLREHRQHRRLRLPLRHLLHDQHRHHQGGFQCGCGVSITRSCAVRLPDAHWLHRPVLGVRSHRLLLLLLVYAEDLRLSEGGLSVVVFVQTPFHDPSAPFLCVSGDWRSPGREWNPLFSCNQVFNVTSTVYLDVSINGLPAGRIVLGLCPALQFPDERRYGEVAPRTSENFRGLCTGEYGPRSNGKPLTYKGTRFSRIIPGFVVQGVRLLSTAHPLGRCWLEYLREEVRRRNLCSVPEPPRNPCDGQRGKEYKPVPVLHHDCLPMTIRLCVGECGLLGQEAGGFWNRFRGNGCSLHD